MDYAAEQARLAYYASHYDPGTWYHVEMWYPPGPNGEHGFAYWGWNMLVPAGGEIILKQLSLHPEPCLADPNPMFENIIFNYGWETAVSAVFGNRNHGPVQVPDLPIAVDPSKGGLYWLQDECHADGVIIVRHPTMIDKAKMANGALSLQGANWWIGNLLSDHFMSWYQGGAEELVVAEMKMNSLYMVQRLAFRCWIKPEGTPTIKLQISSDGTTWQTVYSQQGTGEKSGGFLSLGAPYHFSQDNVQFQYARVTVQGTGSVTPMKLFAWV